MHWGVKAATQRALSALPRSHALNYQLQRRVTKTLPRSDESFHERAGEALRHMAAFERHVPDTRVEDARFYEFGAGWDLVAALLFSALGVAHQTVVDIEANFRPELVDHSLEQIRRFHDELAPKAGRPLAPPPRMTVGAPEDLREFGIDYLAPCDARHTGFADDSFDFASSTYTLEHIPAPDIERILRESARLLRPGALMSSAIDLQDHYHYFDRSLSVFNYLRYSERRWRVVNSPLHYQNRLQLSDYERLFKAAGFEEAERLVVGQTADDLRAVEAIEPAARFRRYAAEDLAARSVYLICRRP